MIILHAADFHLRDKDIEEAEKCLRVLIDTARAEQIVDLIVIAGDIFDSQDVKLDSRAAKLAFRTVAELANIAPVAIVLGTPSHDGKAAEILRYARGKHDVAVATMPEQVYLKNGAFYPAGVTEFPEAVISLAPTPTKQFFQSNGDIKQTDAEIAQAMSGLFMGFAATSAAYKCPHVLVGHWNTTGSLVSETQILTGVDIEISPDHMAMANADFVCLGHIHKAQQIRDNIFYSGSLFANNWGELDEKGFWLHDTDLPASRFIKTPSRKLIRVQEDITTENTCLSLGYGHSFSGASVRLDVTVWQDEAANIDKDKIIEAYLQRGALDVDIRINRVPRENVRSEAVINAETLRDKLFAAAALRGEELREACYTIADLLELNRSPEQIVAAVLGGAA